MGKNARKRQQRAAPQDAPTNQQQAPPSLGSSAPQSTTSSSLSSSIASSSSSCSPSHNEEASTSSLTTHEPSTLELPSRLLGGWHKLTSSILIDCFQRDHHLLLHGACVSFFVVLMRCCDCLGCVSGLADHEHQSTRACSMPRSASRPSRVANRCS